MAKQPFSGWPISSKSFIKLLGAEYELLQKAKGSVLNKFYYAALLVIIIIITTMISIRYAINLLFNVTAVEIILSIFLSFLFGFIYILLVNTFTKEKKDLKNEILNLSNITRVIFVIFMGFLVSKPIEIYFFENGLGQHVNEHRTELLNNHTGKINLMFDDELIKLRKRHANLQAASLKNDAKDIIHNIDSIETKKKYLIFIAQNKIESANFFIYRVKTVIKEYPLSWLVCGCVVLLFLLPGFLIYSISSDEAYFKLKKAYEKEIIEREYTSFSIKYSSLFQNNYNLNLDFFTNFSDPPFNTKRRDDFNYMSSDDFHNKFSTD